MSGTLRQYRDRFIKLGYTERGLSICDNILDLPFSKLAEGRKIMNRVIVEKFGINGVKYIKTIVENINKIIEETDWIKNTPNKSYITDGLITMAVRLMLEQNLAARENNKPNNKPNNKSNNKMIYNPEDEANYTNIAYTNNTLRISNTRKGGRRKGRRYSRRH